MDGYTLITIIGTGMSKEGYKNTIYQFPNGKRSTETSLFLKAILETEYRPIKKVILVGTCTSSWDLLIPDPSGEENFVLWEKVLKACEDKANGISSEYIKELEEKLPSWYNNTQFKLVVHASELSPENVEEIFSAYLEIPDDIAPETNILFDITHGFRSIPLLIFQSLQLNSSKIENIKVELLYGEYIEYIEGKKISHVRDLSKYWDYYEISSAIKLFDEKLDGKLLAKKIEQAHWEKGAKILIRLSEIVECNFSLQMPEALKQLKNALDDYNGSGNPEWVSDVWNMLDEIYKKIKPNEKEPYPVATTVWNYSKLLRKKNLITQGVIALHVAMETIIAEEYDSTKVGDYKWFNGYYDSKNSVRVEGIGERRLKEAYQKSPKLGSKLGQLEELRNRIAHGGGKDKKGNYPHQANIHGILKNIDETIRELIEDLR